MQVTITTFTRGRLQKVTARFILQLNKNFHFLLKGREQMHAILIELKKGLRQMSYKNSMTTFRSFFALLNLKKRGQL